jgi:hypothetical protein
MAEQPYTLVVVRNVNLGGHVLVVWAAVSAFLLLLHVNSSTEREAIIGTADLFRAIRTCSGVR